MKNIVLGLLCCFHFTTTLSQDFNPEGLNAQQLTDTLKFFINDWLDSDDPADGSKIELDIHNVTAGEYRNVVYESQDDILYATYMGNAGFFYREISETRNDFNAFLLGKELFKKARDHGNSMQAASANLNLAQMNFWNSDYGKAIKDYKKAIKEFEVALEDCPECFEDLTYARIGLAELYYDIENFLEADKIYKELTAEGSEISYESKIVCFMNHAKTTAKLSSDTTASDTTVAKNKINRAITFLTDSPQYSPYYLSDAHMVRAAILIDIGNAGRAKTSIDLIDEETVNYAPDKLVSYNLILAGYHSLTGESDTAFAYMQEAIELANNELYDKDLLNAYIELRELALKHDNISLPEDACQKLYDLTKEDLNRAYQAQNSEIDLQLELNDDLTKQKNQAETFQLLSILIGTFLLILMILIIILFSRKIKALKS